jgi:FMN reductase
MSITVVVGNPKPQSRTRAAAVGVAEALAGREPDHVLDLADLGARLLDWSDREVAAAADLVRASDLVVVASPTYKATYTGLLKLFLERFGADELRGVVGVPVLVGADTRHALAVEVHLRPLLVEIGLSVPTRGLFVIDREGIETDAFATWLDASRPRVNAAVGTRR